MGKINVLDKHISELIAAGEVVERPSSVVKELIENSIDANATAIEIEIKNGGTSYIKISDNGQGILREDVPKAFLRHATSKVKNHDDLDSIKTLGFRGEALASIAAVSKVEMITKSENELAGTCYKIEGSDEVSIEDIGCPTGTTIIIKDLFYNTPARMKFLKKDASEASSVSAIVDRIALSHPDISFKFIKNSKEELNTPGDGNIKSCIYSVYGKSFSAGLIPVKYELNGVRVYGFTCDTNSARPNRSMQHFFINGRYVKSKTMMIALEQAYKGSIMVGKFPSCVLYLELSYEVIDVNVHPAKIEVRFINERPIFDAVYYGIKTSINKLDRPLEMLLNDNNISNEKKIINDNLNKERLKVSDPTVKNDYYTMKPIPTNNVNVEEPDVFIPKKNVAYSPLKPIELEKNQTIYKDNPKEEATSKIALRGDRAHSNPFFEENNKEQHNIILKEEKIDSFSIAEDESNKNAVTFFSLDNDKINVIGEVFSTYIVFEKNKDKLLLVDKHAAHERLIYEKLKKESGKSFSQYLLTPLTVTLEKKEYSAVISNLNLFSEAGFEIDDFGSGTVIVRSSPLYLEHDDISDSIIEMAGYILENKENISTKYMDWLYHNIACRAAIKSGDKSNKDELIALIKKLDENPELRHCPHGRPILINITKKEIEKQFGRM